MSAILDAALDTERRQQCLANDLALARGEPITAPASPVLPRARAPLTKRTMRIARFAMIKLCLACCAIGFGAGQVVGNYQLSAPIPKVRLDPDNVQRVPGAPLPRINQRVEV